jgi:hypothetical protein
VYLRTALGERFRAEIDAEAKRWMLTQQSQSQLEHSSASAASTTDSFGFLSPTKTSAAVPATAIDAGDHERETARSIGGQSDGDGHDETDEKYHTPAMHVHAGVPKATVPTA